MSQYRKMERRMMGRRGVKARQNMQPMEWAENVRHNIEDGRKKHEKTLEAHTQRNEKELERRKAEIEKRAKAEGKKKKEAEKEAEAFGKKVGHLFT